MVSTAEATEATAPTPAKSRRARKSTNKPAPKKERKQRAPMSDDHKAKIQKGREQAKIVDNYLNALELHKPKRGRKVTAESRAQKLEQIEKDLFTASGVERLNLLQQQKNLQAQQAAKEPENDIEALQAAFVKIAAEYAANKGIARSTFADMGVPVPVLKEAGLRGTRGPGSKADTDDSDDEDE